METGSEGSNKKCGGVRSIGTIASGSSKLTSGGVGNGSVKT